MEIPNRWGSGMMEYHQRKVVFFCEITPNHSGSLVDNCAVTGVRLVHQFAVAVPE